MMMFGAVAFVLMIGAINLKTPEMTHCRWDRKMECLKIVGY